jgi:hypothetical protein
MQIRDYLLGGTPPAESYSPLSKEHIARQKLFATYWKYYRGRHTRPLKVRPNQPDDNVILNYAKRNVNKGVQFLFGKSVDFEIDETSPEPTKEEAYLDEVWGIDEEKQMLLQKIAYNGAITGTAVVRLYEADPNVQDSLPRIVNIDPSLLDVVTNPDDIDDIRGYHLIWKSNDLWKRHRIDMQMDGTWYVTCEVTKPGSPKWEEVPDESAPWPYLFPPIVTAQNLPLPNEFWGMSDLEDADINDAINFNASNTQRIIKHHAHPKTIGIGFNANDLQNAAVDDFWTIGDKEASVSNLEMHSDLASARDFLAMLKTAYSKVANVPDLDPAVVNVGALSGFALRILYGDLLEATQVKRNTYGALLNGINQALLALGGLGEYGKVEIKNVWADPLPSSDLEQAQTLEIDRRNGLSKETYLKRRGYDPVKEAELAGAEAEAQEAQMGAMMVNAQRTFDQGGKGLPVRDEE